MKKGVDPFMDGLLDGIESIAGPAGWLTSSGLRHIGKAIKTAVRPGGLSTKLGRSVVGGNLKLAAGQKFAPVTAGVGGLAAGAAVFSRRRRG